MVYCGEGEHAASPLARGTVRDEPSGFKTRIPAHRAGILYVWEGHTAMTF